jgi:hypothetical protein
MADSNLGFGSNPYLQPAIDAAQGDTVRNYNLTTQPAFNSAMVRSGSFGNSGIDQMNQESQRQLQTSLGRQANDMRYQDYWNDQNLNRQIYNDSWGQGQQSFQNGMQLLGYQNQANQQNLGFGTQIQNTPMNYWSTFSNGANGIGNGFGTSNSTMSAQGSPMMGALGGAQLGAQFGRSFGSPSVTDGGYGVGQGSAYDGSYDSFGSFTPNRRGM